MDFYSRKQQQELDQQLREYTEKLKEERRIHNAQIDLNKAEMLYDIAKKMKDLSDRERKIEVDILRADYKRRIDHLESLIDLKDRHMAMAKGLAVQLQAAKEDAMKQEIRNAKDQLKLKDYMVKLESERAKVSIQEAQSIAKVREYMAKLEVEKMRANSQEAEARARRIEHLSRLQIERARAKAETMEQKSRLEMERMKTDNHHAQSKAEIRNQKAQLEMDKLRAENFAAKALLKLKDYVAKLELLEDRLKREGVELPKDTSYHFDHSTGYFYGDQTGKWYRTIPKEGAPKITHINRKSFDK